MNIRTDTVEDQNEDRPIDHRRQQIGFCLAIRGEGKSRLLEGFGCDEMKAGFTGLDLHAPPNMENAFWCIPNLDPKNELSKDELKVRYKHFCKNPIPYIKKGNPIKVTILGSQSLMWDELALNKFNDRIVTFEDWLLQGNSIETYAHAYPPMKIRSKWGKELIRFEKLPHITKKEDSETNMKALEIITRVMIEARSERRMIVLNRKAFGSENQYFWTMELIMRGLPDICDKHFTLKTYEDFGLENDKQMKPVQRNWHRMFVLHRELADLAPAKLKADKSGESTPVKKSLLGFSRVCRHWDIDWLADWQHNNSVESAIREQADVWFFKKYSMDLAGDDKKSVFDRINYLRSAILEKGRHSKTAKLLADAFFPPLERLAKKYFYTKFISGNVKLFKVPEIVHQHKEPYMKFTEATGITMWHDKTEIEKDTGAVKSVGAKKSDELAIFNIMWGLRNPRAGKAKSYDVIKEQLTKFQKEDTINYPQDFSTIAIPALRKKYSRWCEKFGEPIEIEAK